MKFECIHMPCTAVRTRNDLTEINSGFHHFKQADDFTDNRPKQFFFLFSDLLNFAEERILIATLIRFSSQKFLQHNWYRSAAG
jgi:hypothetical protein